MSATIVQFGKRPPRSDDEVRWDPRAADAGLASAPGVLEDDVRLSREPHQRQLGHSFGPARPEHDGPGVPALIDAEVNGAELRRIRPLGDSPDGTACVRVGLESLVDDLRDRRSGLRGNPCEYLQYDAGAMRERVAE